MNRHLACSTRKIIFCGTGRKACCWQWCKISNRLSINLLGTGILPVPQEKLSFVEQAGKPVAGNGARYQIDCQLAFYEQARCLFHKKNYLLWNRPESLLLTMVQDIRSIKQHGESVSQTWFPIAARF